MQRSGTLTPKPAVVVDRGVGYSQMLQEFWINSVVLLLDMICINGQVEQAPGWLASKAPMDFIP